MHSALELKEPASPEAALYAFDPGAARARSLDQHMRRRLAESLRHILDQSDGRLEVPPEPFQKFLLQLERDPVSPLAFSFYFDTVLAIEDDDLEQASRWLRELMALPVQAGGPRVAELADPRQDAWSQRYARFMDSDPAVQFEIFPPSRPAADHCRALIHDAFALMDAGDPELAAEIRALLREIVLAAGTEDPKALTFDGASSFMLWGAIIINANRRDGALAMVQMLAHESAHNLLFGLSADGPLVENTCDDLYRSPLRLDPRPMDGIYHATFVTARMHRAVQRLLDRAVLSGSLEEAARRELANNRRLFEQGIKVVREHAKLTPPGEAIIRGAEEYLASV